MIVIRLLTKYHRIFRNKKISILFFSLVSIAVAAQEHRDPDSIAKSLSWSIDSATIIDTVPAPPEEDDSLASGVTETPSEYFSNKTAFSKDTFQLRHLPDSVINKMRQDDDFWYANTVFTRTKEKKSSANSSGKTPLGEQIWFQTLLWLIIIGGFASFIMIYLANSNIFLFRRKPKSIDSSPDEEVETDDIFAINYAREMEKAIDRGNYRFAVRLLFLRLLKQLSEKNIIQYKQGKTNLDYLLQLTPTSYYQDFFRITRNYEYSWYGQFEISPEKFSVIKNDFEKLEQRIG
ncbi:MAG TPA: hypothetical protein VHD35_06915 [Chitinophagaceae bacterium]|nr:hypothetical protein [Chitinophagaceae bacterium]